MRKLSALKALKRLPTPEEQLALMREHVRSGCEGRPGVYRMLSDEGEIVYVGKSKNLRTRLLSYFRCVPGEKGASIVRNATAIEWSYEPSEFAALLTELRLIKRYRPRYNVAMKRDARHFCFIKVTRGSAAKLVVVRGATHEDAATYYGPFHGASRVGDAVRELSDALGLRDCRADQPMHFNDQPELFQFGARTPGCIRYEVKKCLGPCVGGCSTAQYGDRVMLAREFLDGASDAPIEELRAEMDAAAERLEYERAATLRDKVARLEELREQFIRFRFAVETLSFVYRVPSHEGADRVYLIRRGRVRAELAAPSTPAEQQELDRLAAEIFSSNERETAQVPTHEIDELLLLSSWFRRFPVELERTGKLAS
ncbi:MAG: nuclease [Gemmatimonadetes bacterium]|nr:nuclease [Gemmatimonadota bacterium]